MREIEIVRIPGGSRQRIGIAGCGLRTAQRGLGARGLRHTRGGEKLIEALGFKAT
jgi:hypothetical protein